MPEYESLRKGIQIKSLAKSSEKGLQMDILKIEPNWVDQGHFHNDFEWVYILEGSMQDEKGLHKKGDFLINTTERIHKPSSKDGCQLLIVWSGKVTHE
ncbi:MAG: cupin domain-containing protein [archaeon]|nr:cupin domain-containing protein [archaeon]